MFGALSSAFNFADSITGGPDRRARRRTKLGHQYDNRYSLQKEQSLYDRAMARGLTPQEYYGSPAPGAPGVSGGAQVLGNTANQNQIAMAQLFSEQAGKEADRQVLRRGQDTQKEIAQISAGATTGAAQISSDANERIATIVNELGKKQLELKSRELEEYLLQKLKNETELNVAMVEKTLNEAKFTPEFKKEITKMSMGVSNSVNLMLQKRFGVDVSDQAEMQSLSDSEMKNMLRVFMAADSNLYSEIAGLLGAASGEDEFTLDPIRGKKVVGNGKAPGGPQKGLGTGFSTPR